ncbi:MAG: hypothetical protein NVS2B16_22610 [Chloroflexota bacterium]
MKKRLEQPPLFEQRDADTFRELEGQVSRARDAWISTRRRHEIGSDEEKTAWFHYRAVSDRMWALVHAGTPKAGSSHGRDNRRR